MTDTSIKPDVPGGKVTVLAIIISAWLASYIMTQCSLHGIDFKTFGVDSEMVKSTIIATAVSFISKPKTFVSTISDGILFVRETGKTWYNNLTGKGE